MKYKCLIINVLIVLILLFSLCARSEIQLGTAIMPPYQKETLAGISGSAVDTILCALEKIPVDANIEVFPSSRLVYSLNHLDMDAIFSLGDREPTIGVPSSPVVLEKWYWFYNKYDLEITPNNKNLYVAVVRGSEAEYWLRNKKYLNLVSVKLIKQALKMLNAGRVGAVLADNLQVQEASREMKLMSPSKYTSFQKFTSLKVYFSPSFIDKNPSVLPEFNNNIQYCDPAGSYLTVDDRYALLAIANKVRSWIDSNNIKQLLINSTNAKGDISNNEIKRLDKQWRDNRGREMENSITLISDVFDSQISKKLKRLKKTSEGLFDEIIVTDKQGLNVGLTDISSDYWQGDEEKYLQTVLSNNSKVFIDGIRFDSSSSTFQSQISFSIIDEFEGPVGMVVLGVNVESALKLNSNE